MEIIKQVLTKARCERCNHKWIVRVERIRVCPKCKNPYWDIKRSGNKLSFKKDNKKSFKKNG